MARIRSIKPEFFTSGQLVECSTNARLLFVGTWVFADDCGRHPLNYKQLKMEVFPGDEITSLDVEKWFSELWKAGLVTVYKDDSGRLYFVVNGWHHQKIDRPQPARYPNPVECETVSLDRSVDECSTNGRRMVDECSSLMDQRDTRDTIGEKDNSCSFDEQNEPNRKSRNGYPEAFERFWNAYPKYRRSAKGAAYKAFTKALRLTDAETLIAKAVEYAASPKGSGEFSMMPSTWLNGNCWEDAPEAWGIAPAKKCYVPGPGDEDFDNYTPYGND